MPFAASASEVVLGRGSRMKQGKGKCMSVLCVNAFARWQMHALRAGCEARRMHDANIPRTDGIRHDGR
jgi:hypothetical protein